MGRPKSATGNNPFGFTFVEVMVALVVLTSGIVMIYKSFFLCADYLNNLTERIYASSLLDEKIGDITESFAEWPAKNIDFGDNFVDLTINHKPIHFIYVINAAPLGDVKSVWRVDVGLGWNDGSHNMHMQRSAYMLRWEELLQVKEQFKYYDELMQIGSWMAVLMGNGGNDNTMFFSHV